MAKPKLSSQPSKSGKKQSKKDLNAPEAKVWPTRPAELSDDEVAALASCDAEDVAIEVIEDLVDRALREAHDRHVGRRSHPFAAASCANQLWRLLTLVPPLFNPDKAPKKLEAEAEPVPPLIDSWGSQAIPSKVVQVEEVPGQHSQPRQHSGVSRRPSTSGTRRPSTSGSARKSIVSPKRASKGEAPTAALGKPAMTKMVSRPRTKELWRSVSSKNNRAIWGTTLLAKKWDEVQLQLREREKRMDDLFDRADLKKSGVLDMEELLMYLQLQHTVTMSKLKKVLEELTGIPANKLLHSALEIERRLFGQVIEKLQSADLEPPPTSPKKKPPASSNDDEPGFERGVWALDRLAVYSLGKCPKASPRAAEDAEELLRILRVAAEEKEKNREKPKKEEQAMDPSRTLQYATTGAPEAITQPPKPGDEKTTSNLLFRVKAIEGTKPPTPTEKKKTKVKRPATAPAACMVKELTCQKSLVTDFSFVPECGVTVTEQVILSSTTTTTEKKPTRRKKEPRNELILGPPKSRYGPDWPSDPSHPSLKSFAETQRHTRSAPTLLARLEEQRPQTATSVGSAMRRPSTSVETKRRRSSLLPYNKSLSLLTQTHQGGTITMEADPKLIADMLSLKQPEEEEESPLILSEEYRGGTRSTMTPSSSRLGEQMSLVDLAQLGQLDDLERATIRELRAGDSRPVTAPSPLPGHANKALKGLRARAKPNHASNNLPLRSDERKIGHMKVSASQPNLSR